MTFDASQEALCVRWRTDLSSIRDQHSGHESMQPRPDGAAAMSTTRRNIMLHYAIVFLVIALIAGVLGFGGIAGSAVGIAKILFLVFIVLFLASLIMGRRGPV